MTNELISVLWHHAALSLTITAGCVLTFYKILQYEDRDCQNAAINLISRFDHLAFDAIGQALDNVEQALLLGRICHGSLEQMVLTSLSGLDRHDAIKAVDLVRNTLTQRCERGCNLVVVSRFKRTFTPRFNIQPKAA